MSETEARAGGRTLGREALRKVTLRLIPFMFLLYVFNILDRVNISIAVLTMKADLGFSDRVYGLGAGMFFVGYFFFEVPSNVILERVGARIWMARIMLTWGAVASCLMFIRSPASFYTLRFLLGVAEAGFFPGMMLYLTYWFPESVRGRTVARFVLANTTAGIVGGPLGAQFMKLNGLAGLHGWQWLFLLEGVPTMLLGVAVFFYLTDRPERAHWLAPAEREWLIRCLAREQSHRQQYHHMSLLEAFRYPRVLHLAGIFFLNILAGSGLGLFTNLILKQRTGWSDQQVLWTSAIPPLLGAASMMISAAHSDRIRERRRHVAGGLALGALGIALVAWTRSPLATVGALAVVAIGTGAANAPFWALTTGFLSGLAAAGGIAFINSVGNSGSFFGSVLMGYLKDYTRSYESGITIMAAVMAIASVVAFLLPADPAQQHLPAEPEQES
jgi:ACS family tartrate transporter-like MFS transporter